MRIAVILKYIGYGAALELPLKLTYIKLGYETHPKHCWFAVPHDFRYNLLPTVLFIHFIQSILQRGLVGEGDNFGTQP